MRIPCAGDPLTIGKISRTFSDPSLFPDAVSGADEFTSYQALLEKGGSLKMVKGLRGMDLAALGMIEYMWPKVGPIRYKIWCPNPVARQTDGIYLHGTPNLLWELMNLRRKEISPTLLEKKGNPEGLVDNKNDAFDARKYILTGGGPGEYVETAREKWLKLKAELLERTPDLPFDSMIIYKEQFEREQQKKREVVSWI